MNPRVRWWTAALVALAGIAAGTAERPRLAVLTDIGGDPDDQQSLVRLMVYANEFEIEAFVASASGTPGELKEGDTPSEAWKDAEGIGPDLG